MASRLLLLVAVVAMHMQLYAVDAKTLRPWPPDCSTTNGYTGNSQYKKNLDQLLATLPAAAAENGWFYEGSSSSSPASDPDQMFGLIMCYADRDAAECLDCLSQASAAITAVCPGSRSARVVYNPCVLQYSDASIRHEADLTVLICCLRLMSELAAAATASPLRLANGSTPYLGSEEMYGLAQCTRDLNGSECARCVSDYVGQLGSRFGNKTGGVIKGYSCYLRFQVAPLAVTLPPAPSQSLLLATGGSSSSSKIGMVVGVSIGSVLILVVLGLCMCFLLWRRRRKQAELHEETRAMEDEFEKGLGPKQFQYVELAIATDNFSETHKLGEGGFGSVYRGFLKDMNLHVAIKRVSKGSRQGRKEYASEVRIISRLRHRNLVLLIGWCHGDGKLLLVYELMPNGSLDKHLYSVDNRLSWSLRHKIVLEIASAILYLHEEWEQCVLHRDIKPSNVMLDASFNAKLGDFGLARLVDHARRSHTTVLAGTFGYMDPECGVRGMASVQSDIYSFGVVLLEIACGRSPIVVLDDDVIHLVCHVSDLHSQGRVLDAVDPRLNGEFDAQEMKRVIMAGLWCTQDDQGMRASIRQVVSVLRLELPLPSLAKRPLNTDPSSIETNNV
uniref:Protein kinase domain-containing protein n=1 Tax=Leersia perrieri TaxID=77586 RepID=A0A0D9X1V2_9ORYZ